MVGTITVSGLAQEEDHKLVIQSIRKYLAQEQCDGIKSSNIDAWAKASFGGHWRWTRFVYRSYAPAGCPSR